MSDLTEIVVVGSLNLDLLLHVSHLPMPGKTQTATAYTRQPGGKGANQAVAAARLGAPTSMLGCVGNDDGGRLLMDALHEAGIATEAIAHCAEPTGTAAILLVPSGENSIVVAPGANSMLSLAHTLRHKKMLAGAGMILTQLETPIAVLEATLVIAKEAGVPVMLDPAPAVPLSPEVLRQIAWFTPNETEARFYAGDAMPAPLSTSPAIETAAHALCVHLQTMGPRNILLKLGSKGAAVLAEGGEWLFAKAPHVDVVDTTGAGDTLNAAFATALLRGDPPDVALRFAVVAASLSVMQMGAMASLPTRVEVERYLSKAAAE